MADTLPGALKDCIACGRCLDVCPLFQATQREELTPKATHVLHRALREGREDIRLRQAEALAAMCLGCGRCSAACPQGLNTPEVVAALRAAHGGWEPWLWGQWIAKGGLLWPAAATVARALPAAVRDAVPPARGLCLPSVTPWLAVQEWDVWGGGREVALFPGCTATRLRPQWIAMARRLLEYCGFRVVIPPGFGCCGATLGHAGLGRAQGDMQRRNLEAWRKAGRPPVVTFCASCRAGLMDYGDAGGDAGGDALETARFREAVRPLAPMVRQTRFAIDEAGAPHRAVWHQPCHAREDNPDGPFLAAALGARLVRQVTDRCCGLGGVMQLGSSGLPQRVAARCWEGLTPDDAETPGTQVLTGCAGCTVQLAATRPEDVEVIHWLDILKI